MHPDEIAIERPCNADWTSMTAVAGGRHCDHCDLQVTELAALTEREARALLAERGTRRICVRYQPTRDGGVRLRPEPLVPASRLLSRVKPLALAAATLVAGCDEPYWTWQARHHPVDFAKCVLEPHCDAFAPPPVVGGI